MLTSHSVTEPNKWLVALWAVLAAAVAIVLLYVGGLGALQTFTILVAAPFVFVMCGLCGAICGSAPRPRAWTNARPGARNNVDIGQTAKRVMTRVAFPSMTTPLYVACYA